MNTVVEFNKSINVDNGDKTETRLKLKLIIVEDDQKMMDLAHLFVKDVQCAILVYEIESMMQF